MKEWEIDRALERKRESERGRERDWEKKNLKRIKGIQK